MHWPEHSDPAWHMDSMVAHLVVSPILNGKRPQIELWRFHRRAGRDGAGHQFNFILLNPENSGLPFPLILTGPPGSTDYFRQIDDFINKTLGAQAQKNSIKSSSTTRTDALSK